MLESLIVIVSLADEEEILSNTVNAQYLLLASRLCVSIHSFILFIVLYLRIHSFF